MARTRSIKPSFFKNELLAQCSDQARLVFIGLWTLADRAGRLEDRPLRIRAELYPYGPIDIEKCLVDLERNGFLLRYKTEKNGYIQIVNFEKHQICHVREPVSTIPAPTQHSTGTVPAPDQHSVGKVQDYPLTSNLLPQTSNLLDTQVIDPTNGFEAFWSMYPRKVKKKTAARIWKAKRLEMDFEKLVDDVRLRIAQDDQWQRGFIPHPTTYLTQERWNDEISKPRRSANTRPMSAVDTVRRATAERAARDSGKRIIDHTENH